MKMRKLGEEFKLSSVNGWAGLGRDYRFKIIRLNAFMDILVYFVEKVQKVQPFAKFY